MSQLRVDEITDEPGTGSPSFPNGVPAQAGQVAFFAMNTAPTGWLKANGAEVSRSTYSALFSAIGTTFGAGDGSTTFALPDLRGEFIRGWDDGRGVDSGRGFGTAQGAAFASHNHAILEQTSFTTHSHNGTGGAVASRMTGGAGGGAFNTNNNAINSTGGSETRPRNIAMLVCIKY